MTSADSCDPEPDGAGAFVVPAPSAAAVELFGDRLDLASRYVGLLASDGVAHGHIGPREVDRLWSRHLMNSALLADLLPTGARFADVGTGAGLPGLPMVIRRPDLQVVLVEPMLRRTNFLARAVDELGLAQRASVVRGRAEDKTVREVVSSLDWVVARAVAPLDRLVRCCLPLLAPGGRLLALKGESAADEVEQHRQSVARIGGGDIEIHELTGRAASEGETPETTWVVSVRRQSARRGKAKGRR